MSLYCFTKDNWIENGHVTMACNGLSALWKAQATHLTEPSEAHYDLISVIRVLRQSLPVQLTFQHVKGHQNSGQMMVLPCLAWMNIKMDKCAMEGTGGKPYT